MHTYTHTYTHTHTYIHTYINTSIRPYTNTCIHNHGRCRVCVLYWMYLFC